MANYFDPKAYAKLPGRSKFDLSYRNSFTAKMGQLIPIVSKPVIPGDRFRVGFTYQMQLAPMLNPVYDGLEVNFEAFFVPNRILDPRWREFWTGYNQYDQTTPVDIAPLTLSVSCNYGDGTNLRRENPILGVSSLLDFLGVQFSEYTEAGFAGEEVKNGSDLFVRNLPPINAYPVLAYNRIYDDWYRNERVQKASLSAYYNNGDVNNRSLVSSYGLATDPSPLNGGFRLLDSSLGSTIPCQLHYRNYKKDPYTTALPEPIIGGDVRIPVGEGFDSIKDILPGSTSVSVTNSTTGSSEGVIRNSKLSSSNGISLNALALGTIQQLKLALKEYSYRMKDTYNGNRYVESLYAHYGVVVPDSTLQRSVYLGSGRDYVNFGEVYQTSSGDGQGDNGALGDYAGRGNASGTHYMFDESFYEPGFFFVLMSISPRSRYFQGIKRVFTRFDRADYFSPEYQNIGDDFISTNEIFNNTNRFSTGNQSDFEDTIFGYNSRWLDLKYSYDELHGDFANPKSPMFNWNFSRSLTSLDEDSSTTEGAPIISPEFSVIKPINKPFVSLDTTNDNFFVDVAIKIDALRPILAVESF